MLEFTNRTYLERLSSQSGFHFPLDDPEIDIFRTSLKTHGKMNNDNSIA